MIYQSRLDSSLDIVDRIWNHSHTFFWPERIYRNRSNLGDINFCFVFMEKEHIPGIIMHSLNNLFFYIIVLLYILKLALAS